MSGRERFLIRGRPKQQGFDYEHYYFSLSEFILYMAQGMLLIGIVIYLFYHSLILYLVSLPLLYPWMRSRQRKKVRERRNRLKSEFKEGLNALKASIQAGYSIENAFGEAEKDLRLLLGEDADICREFRYMNGQLSLNVPVEELLWSFAARSGLPDARSFAEVFSAAKRTKGDLSMVMERTASMIGEKADTEAEISTLISAKRFEFLVMSVVPFGIILYMKLSFGDFLDTLYGSAMGRVVMTAGLLIYLAAYGMGTKITNIGVE